IQQSAAGAVDLTNSYRPDGLRHRRTDSSGTTQMIWDEDEPLAQVDTAGNLMQYWSRAVTTQEWRYMAGRNGSRIVWGLAAILAIFVSGGVAELGVRLRPYWVAKYRGMGADLRGASLPWAPLRGAELGTAD